jgi:Transmembrane secretion effector
VALVAESSGTALAVPALRARIPAIVGTGPRLSSANALNSFSGGVVRLIGGPIGGILFAALGIRVLIAADALSYLVAAGAIMMTAREASREPAARVSSVRAIIGDLREGLAILLRERSAWALLPVSVIYPAANASLSAVIVAFGIRQLGGSRPTGFLFSALGVGFLVGAPILRMTLDRISARYLLSGSLAATAASTWFSFTPRPCLQHCPPRSRSACSAPCRWSFRRSERCGHMIVHGSPRRSIAAS